MNEKDFKKIIRLIRQRENFLILMHQSPDGDTIASSLALMLALKKIGKNVQCVSSNPIPPPFQFLPSQEKVKDDFLSGDWEVMFLLDCGDAKRTGFPERIKEFAQRKKTLVNIDHHRRNDLHKIANINIFSEEAVSAGEILFSLLRYLNSEIDQNIATCLLTSIYFDTGGFQHSNTSDRVLSKAAWLLSKGARLDKISKNVVLSKSVSSLKLWGTALTNIRINQALGIISSFITQKDIAEVGATEADIAGVINIINTIPGFKMAILFVELPEGKVKASIRTEDETVDVSQFASIFGGGGLKKAAGFVIQGRLTKVQNSWKIVH